MKVLLKMIAALLITKAKLIGPGGTEAFVTDSRHIKQQILFINRSRQGSPDFLLLVPLLQ